MRAARLAVVLVSVACAQASARSLAAQGLPPLVAGRYTLATVDGHALPHAPTEPGRPADAPVLEIVASTLIVKADGHFRMAMTYRTKQAGIERIFDNPFTGTIVGDSAGYTMRWDDAGMTPATWNSGTLTYTNEGQSYAYRRARG
jgi:hypothetical protein